MDPSRKLDYFVEAGYPEDALESIRTMVFMAYKRYAPAQADDDEADDAPAPAKVHCSLFFAWCTG